MKIFVWNSRSLFIGRLEHLSFHSERSAYLICSLSSENFRIAEEPEGDWKICRSVLVPQGLQVQIDAKNDLISAMSIETQDVHKFLPDPKAARIQIEPVLLENAFRNISILLQETDSDTDKQKELLEELDRLIPANFTPRKMDPRISAVVEKVSEDLSENISTEELAILAGLSVSRLEHLFKEASGISLSEFRTWQRVKAAALAIANGENLTEAAQSAGFYDSAHFSNSFKKTYGFPPSLFLNPKTKFHFF
ncbi:AraC family transcriptional regulator [Leptospira langatensis]|uniref:AraC family transcriptional regulator n=1 Tax=Leptospira langatensis TaxID=2484983 RepID=A0A5F1ZQ02_9LEPT|nr:AraC family transcriptional regulator [Leptospira langatensis]TGK05227.1 AraC family transcriptional regulator [Leptospira langatensis]TGL38363.1 AraC family transcriptional regulator [Leptospira langatensis]